MKQYKKYTCRCGHLDIYHHINSSRKEGDEKRYECRMCTDPYIFHKYQKQTGMQSILDFSDNKNPAAVALGSITSIKKARSSRKNGKLGGRPKSKIPTGK